MMDGIVIRIPQQFSVDIKLLVIECIPFSIHFHFYNGSLKVADITIGIGHMDLIFFPAYTLNTHHKYEVNSP